MFFTQLQLKSIIFASNHSASLPIDFDTENDGAVTIRERDSMQQIRLPIGELKAYLEEKVFF